MKSTISKINVIPCPVTDLYQHDCNPFPNRKPIQKSKTVYSFAGSVVKRQRWKFCVEFFSFIRPNQGHAAAKNAIIGPLAGIKPAVLRLRCTALTN